MPKTDCLIATSRCHTRAVGVDGHRHNAVGVAFECVEQRAVRDAPQLDGPVARRGHKLVPTRVERDGEDGRPVSCQDALHVVRVDGADRD